MIRIHLDDATRDELRALRREPLPPKVRDRIEMLTLADAGWSAPRIADHLGHCGHTVRDLLEGFLDRGIGGPLPAPHRPAPGLRPSRPRGRGTAAVAGRGPHLDRPPAQPGPRRTGHRVGATPGHHKVKE
jgi:Homeodomain-like domain